ncbi:MerR family transcriptional regulator [Sphingomonas sp. SAFR-052]|uniref:MerR family transcriptional regulator n=1 Tax=Sphingomonas sp. SAFR-052 TaxID=3436867 RepID=UPI003F81934D
MPPPVDKSATAYRTIGEVARDLGVPQHRLRYWEGRFPQIRPLTRAGDRRYYRPEDVALLRRIQTLLGEQGYSVRGVQQLLAQEAKAPAVPVAPIPRRAARITELRAIRSLLADALAADGAAD